MTERKLWKYMRKSLPPLTGSKQLTPEVLTDSKGKYLQPYCQSGVEKEIKWRWQSGRRTEDGFRWLLDNLDRETGHLDNMLLIVWLGTCELTSFYGTFISLSAD